MVRADMAVHADLDNLERHAAFDRRLLLSHINDAKAAFAQFLQQLVVADLVAGLFGNGRRKRGGQRGGFNQAGLLKRVGAEENVRLAGGGQQFVDPAAQVGIVRTRQVQKSLALGPVLQPQRGLKEALFM